MASPAIALARIERFATACLFALPLSLSRAGVMYMVICAVGILSSVAS